MLLSLPYVCLTNLSPFEELVSAAQIQESETFFQASGDHASGSPDSALDTVDLSVCFWVHHSHRESLALFSDPP